MATLAESVPGGRRVPADNLHLTLAFLGTVRQAQQHCLEQALDRLTIPTVEMTFDRVGCFRRSGILWLGMSHPPIAVKQLADNLEKPLVECGFSIESRPFHPHITIARRYTGIDPVDTVIEPFNWLIDKITLLESHTLPGGARYHVLRHWPGR